MATKYLTWRFAVEVICVELVQFHLFRSQGRSVAETAELMLLSAETAEHYEDAVSRLVRDLKNEAAPDSTLHGRPAAAPQKAHANKTEGVDAP